MLTFVIGWRLSGWFSHCSDSLRRLPSSRWRLVVGLGFLVFTLDSSTFSWNKKLRCETDRHLLHWSCAAAFEGEGLGWVEGEKRDFYSQAMISWNVLEMTKYFPFFPRGENFKLKGNSLKSTKPPQANVILEVKLSSSRKINFRQRSHQWHKLAGNLGPNVRVGQLPRGRMMEPGQNTG